MTQAEIIRVLRDYLISLHDKKDPDTFVFALLMGKEDDKNEGSMMLGGNYLNICNELRKLSVFDPNVAAVVVGSAIMLLSDDPAKFIETAKRVNKDILRSLKKQMEGKVKSKKPRMTKEQRDAVDQLIKKTLDENSDEEGN